MNYLDQIDLIIDILDKYKKYELSKALTSLKNNSFTGTEILASITSKLLTEVKNDKDLNNIIGKYVDELHKYCMNLGMEINSWL